MRISFFAVLASLCFSFSASAQSDQTNRVAVPDTTPVVHVPVSQNQKQSPALRFLIGSSLELGGDEVAKVFFTNGNTQSVRAGQGISLHVGGQYQVPTLQKLLFRATVGFKYVTTAADNAHIRLTRIPIQLTANWMLAEKLRFGTGLVSHQAINFSADGIGQDITFKGANGAVFELAYSGIGLSYTLMKYTDQANNVYSANAIGLQFSIVIPNK